MKTFFGLAEYIPTCLLLYLSHLCFNTISMVYTLLDVFIPHKKKNLCLFLQHFILTPFSYSCLTFFYFNLHLHQHT